MAKPIFFPPNLFIDAENKQRRYLDHIKTIQNAKSSIQSEPIPPCSRILKLNQTRQYYYKERQKMSERNIKLITKSIEAGKRQAPVARSAPTDYYSSLGNTPKNQRILDNKYFQKSAQIGIPETKPVFLQTKPVQRQVQLISQSRHLSQWAYV